MKNWMLVISDGEVAKTLPAKPELDRAATEALVERLWPGGWEVSAEGNLAESVNPDEELVSAGVFAGLTVLASDDFALDDPTELDEQFLAEGRGRTIRLHAQHSAVDWFACGWWAPDGTLVRALGLSPEFGVEVDRGDRLPVELPYWAGAHPLAGDEPYPFVFHPLDLAEAVRRDWFGFVYEGVELPGDPDPFETPLLEFRRR
jgi:hypothetical protein